MMKKTVKRFSKSGVMKIDLDSVWWPTHGPLAVEMQRVLPPSNIQQHLLPSSWLSSGH